MATTSGTTPEIRILSAAAVREIVDELGEAYRRATGIKISAEYSRSPLVRDRIRAGEIFDIVVTTQDRIEELTGQNKVLAGSTAVLACSGIGVAVKAGQPKPAIGSVDAFTAALRRARSIACADPAFGTASGLYLVDLFARLGMTAELKPKLRLIGAIGGQPVVVCQSVADGHAELGIQQVAEIISVPGVDLVGPLPPELQHMTEFAVAVAAVSPNSALAHNFAAFLTSDAAKTAIATHGMEPA